MCDVKIIEMSKWLRRRPWRINTCIAYNVQFINYKVEFTLKQNFTVVRWLNFLLSSEEKKSYLLILFWRMNKIITITLAFKLHIFVIPQLKFGR